MKLYLEIRLLSPRQVKFFLYNADIHNRTKEKVMTKFHFYTFDNLVFVGAAEAQDWMEARKIVAWETGVDARDLVPQNWQGLSACEPKTITGMIQNRLNTLEKSHASK